MRRGVMARALVLAFTLAFTFSAGTLPAEAQGPATLTGLIAHDSGRVSVVATSADEKLARSLLASAVGEDSFPGLPRPRQRVVIFVAPDSRTFRDWNGGGAPEWGAALAYPALSRIVMQGRRAPSSAGDPVRVLRHELAHLALHEMLGDLPPRWFDEGYATLAAGEMGGDGVVTTNLALALRGLPRLSELDGLFAGGERDAQAGYSLAVRAVEEIARGDPERGLSLFFQYWRETQSFDRALRRAYGETSEALEARWRSRTRLRYGALALVTDVSLGSILLLLVLGPLWWMRRSRDRERMERLRIADAEQERRERESALAELLGLGAEPPQGGEGDPPERVAQE
jgi:hypothetical protein